MPCMRSALIWRMPGRQVGQILIEAEPLILMDRFWQDESAKPESGGILLGYRRDKHLHVTMASTPQPGDEQRRYLFNRSKRAHQELALRQWRASAQTVDYLGEWHTHPETHPSPSGLDQAEWAKICARAPNPMLFMIVGWSGEHWLGCSKGGQVVRCARVAREI